VACEDFTEINAKNKEGETALHLAAMHGFPDLCESILARADFTDINAKEEWGKTLRHLATSEGLSDACAAILARAELR